MVKWLDILREKPALWYRRNGGIMADLSRAFSVAHNAGDAVDVASRALEYGADVIEIDVMTRRGRLVAGHPRRAWILSQVWLWTIPLERAWATASRAKVVKLDLKESSEEYVARVVAFLVPRREAPVFAVTRDGDVLRMLADKAPWLGRVLSVTASDLAELKRDEALAAVIDGVSGHPDRFDAETMAWLDDRQLVSMTSVVNSMAQADDLLRRGVNGIITDNLAVMEAIGRASGRDVRGVLFSEAGVIPSARPAV